MIDRHTVGMDGYNKACVIDAFGDVPSDQLTPAFEALISRHTVGMNASAQSERMHIHLNAAC